MNDIHPVDAVASRSVSTPSHSYFVIATRGLVPRVAAELRELGARVVRESPAGLRVRGPLEFAYRICMWSRCASRVILHLHDAAIGSVDDLYRVARELPWEDHVAPDGTICVDVVAHGDVVTHSRFAAQRVKDAVVDRMRDRFGVRPSVDTAQPDLRIHAYIRGRGCSLGIDLSGEPLHRRGWRREQGPAPLKETLAAGLVLHSGWLARARDGETLIDPMCGAGTILIEAAGMMADLAPQRLRQRFGFTNWRGHDEAAWQRVCDDAKLRAAAAAQRSLPTVYGFDADPEIIEVARRNAERAGVDEYIDFSVAALSRDTRWADEACTVLTNPPYGERIGSQAQVARLYDDLGTWLRAHPRARASLLVAEAAPLERLRIRLGDAPRIDNGPIPCIILDAEHTSESAHAQPVEANPLFARRLKKNLRRLAPWVKQYEVSSYRVYDADIPEYNAAVDVYGDLVHLQEYRAPRSVDPLVAAERLAQMIDGVAEVLQIPRENIIVKHRRPQRPGARYGHFDDRGEFVSIIENGHVFLVNLTDYLDTGLFLDHRPLRRWISASTAGKRFLNLFCYTATSSVVAARAGATTTSVDLSNTYLEWAERNFRANQIDAQRHTFIRHDCMTWLALARRSYDLVLLDPPSFSASKGMTSNLEVQRDHVELIRGGVRQLASGGELIFSCNLAGFVLDTEAMPELSFEDITRRTLDPDFRREPPAHRCWRVSVASAGASSSDSNSSARR